MEIEIRVTKSNGQSQAAVSDITRFSDAYLLMDTIVDIRETGYDSEFVIYIQPQHDISLKKIELSINFDSRGALVYNSGTSGYSYSGIVSADTPIPFSRDVFLAANCEITQESRFSFLNIGFTSFEKFFTYFKYLPGKITAVYNMENRTITAGTILRLESIMIDDTVCAGLFLESLSETIAHHQKLSADKPLIISRSVSGLWNQDEDIVSKPSDIPDSLSEFCSSIIDGQDVNPMPVALIDCEWQSSGSFSCIYQENEELFPSGLSEISEKCSQYGFRAGLNYAPALISDDSPHFKEYNYRLYNDRNYVPSFSNVYPMNLSSQDVQSETLGFIKGAVKQWGTGFFRFDHLDALLFRQGDNNSPVVFQRDSSVSLFRNFFKKIRQAAGDNVFIAASGPFGECAGIFDGIVVSALTPGSDSLRYDDAADGRRMIRDSVLNMIYRSFYNGRLFRSFSEGIVSYSKISDDEGNVFSKKLTDDEISLLVTAAAFSGGALSFGSDMNAFSIECRNVISKVLPPSGISAKPVDFWEYPFCTHTMEKIGDKSVRTEIHVLYNFEDFEDTKSVRMTEPSVFINMLTGEIAASGRAGADFTLRPYSALPVLVKQLPDYPALLWTDDNIYRGALNTSDMFFSDTLIITSDAPKGTVFHIYVPYGRAGDVYVNDKKLRLNTLDFRELGEGAVFTYRL